MAQYGKANKEILLRGYRAAVRNPTYSVYIDLVGDVTEDVIQIDVGTEIEDSLREPNFGRGAIVLSNEEGKYYAGNTSKIEENAMVRVYAGFDRENIPIWTGIVTDPQASGATRTMTLSVAQLGERLREHTTYGDLDDEDTPKELVEWCCKEAGISDPIIQRADDFPSTFVFGHPTIEDRRDFWSLIHASCLATGMFPYFDVNGVLNLIYRAHVNDIDLVIKDDFIADLEYEDDGELINHKIMDFGTSVKWGDATWGDRIHPWQWFVEKFNDYSKNRWGTHTDYQTDELIGTYARARNIALEILDFFSYRRSKYRVRVPGIPFIELFDRFEINSQVYNVYGRYTVIGIIHRIVRGKYTTELLVLSQGERL
jgi:hypothetical protein